MKSRPTVPRSLLGQLVSISTILSHCPDLISLLHLIRDVGLPNAYVGGGAIPQIVWNDRHGYPLTLGIKDFDIIYYDAYDLSSESQEAYRRLLRQEWHSSTIDLDVVNEAATHVWYAEKFGFMIPQYCCVEDAVYTFPTTASAIAVRLDDHAVMEICSPHGLTDLLNLVVRPNRIQITRDWYEAKCQRWRSIWPQLCVEDWDYVPEQTAVERRQIHPPNEADWQTLRQHPRFSAKKIRRSRPGVAEQRIYQIPLEL
jgi:uncharacterized protein